MEERKLFLLVNGEFYYEFNPQTTKCDPISKDQFTHVFNSENDRLTLLPVIKLTHCPGCQKSDEARAKTVGLEFKTDDEYLKYIYSESDPKKRIEAKKLYDSKFGK